MPDKILAWIANTFLASLLVLVTVSPGAHAQSLSVELTGTAVVQTVGNLQISPARIDTGLVDIGESVNQVVQLLHTGVEGSDPVQINAVSIIGDSANEFSTEFSGFVSMLPGESLDVSVTFTPTVPGKKSASLRLDISGSTAPHVLIIESNARFPLTSNLEPNDEVVAFGQVIQNVSKNVQLILTNAAEEPDAPVINISGSSLSGVNPAAFNVDLTPVTLAPGESVTVNIQLQSAVDGFKSATLQIDHDGINPSVEVTLQGNIVEPAAIPVNFGQSILKNANPNRPTALAFGPNGHLYVTEMNGLIHEYTVTRNGKNNYTANKVDTINVVAQTQNHNDDGSTIPTKQRLLTGILAVGTAANPELYMYSADWRQGGGPAGTDTNLDTNSGILHRLVKNGNNWVRQDLVRGLPRSEENHQGNGLVMKDGKILLAMGGNTNQGVPSNNFAGLSETALSAAILEIDIQAIGNGPYDLPTLDDEDQPGPNDNNDPFGGNNGKNQAKLVAGGPVQIYSPGFRNAYDLVLTQSGKLYVTDNGPNAGWGAIPGNACGNGFSNGGQTFIDQLHFVPHKGYYAGHPNPVRGNKNNTFNASNPQSPVEVAANPEECVFKNPNQDGSLAKFPASTNGIAEYTAGNFGGAMQGDLLLTGFDKALYRVVLNNAGNGVTSQSKLVSGLGQSPLDVVTRSSNQQFPGTIWVVDNIANDIFVFEPADF